MKTTLVIFATLIVYTLAVPTLENCKCGDGYEAKTDADGKTTCHGIHLLALKPCNLPTPPKCICEKEKATSVLTDKDGTFCAIREKGVDVKKWPCENEAEWKTYKEEYAKYEKEQH